MATAAMLGALLNGSPHVISWGWLQITLVNLIVIVLMVALFVAALLLPFPGGRR